SVLQWRACLPQQVSGPLRELRGCWPREQDQWAPSNRRQAPAPPPARATQGFASSVSPRNLRHLPRRRRRRRRSRSRIRSKDQTKRPPLGSLSRGIESVQASPRKVDNDQQTGSTPRPSCRNRRGASPLRQRGLFVNQTTIDPA